MSDALYNALGTNDATQVAAVLSSMEDDVNSTENARLSPLGFYLQHGDDPQADVMQLLINAGAGVNNIGDGCWALIPAMNGRDDPALFVLLLNAPIPTMPMAHPSDGPSARQSPCLCSCCCHMALIRHSSMRMGCLCRT
jgi:hypothetical protein